MYKAFYNLKRNPFEITPDPSFLCPTKRHNEALAALYYGVRRHKGFVVLTGEVGTGKTLLLRCLLQLLKKNNDVAYAYVFNGKLTPVEFLQYVAGDLGLPSTGKNKSELLLQLAKYVIARGQKQLQILLVGQPELDNKLDSVELRQLKQRIALRSHLAPLDLEETKGYIERRLRLAGNPDAANLFPQETIGAVYRHCRGIPRLINTICENALIAAYSRQAPSVTPTIIDSIAMDFRLDVETRPLEDIATSETMNVQKAARTLLELYALLRNEQSREEELRTR